MCVASAGQYESFEHVKIFGVSNVNNFYSWLCTLKMCSYHLQHAAYVLYSSHCNLYYVIHACNISDEPSANVPR